MRALCLTLVCLVLIGCSGPARHPDEYLDPQTGATVSHVRAPIIFARAHQDVAANARQYANIVAASVNRAGEYQYLLLLYNWTSVDPRLGAGRRSGDTLVLLADDRAIRIRRDDRSLHDAGIEHAPLRPLHFHGRPWIYSLDHDTLQFIAQARRLRLQFDGDPDSRPFDIWKDGRRELAQLAATAQ
jgi:hypothetical protein